MLRQNTPQQIIYDAGEIYMVCIARDSRGSHSSHMEIPLAGKSDGFTYIYRGFIRFFFVCCCCSFVSKINYVFLKWCIYLYYFWCLWRTNQQKKKQHNIEHALEICTMNWIRWKIIIGYKRSVCFVYERCQQMTVKPPPEGIPVREMASGCMVKGEIVTAAAWEKWNGSVLYSPSNETKTLKMEWNTSLFMNIMVEFKRGKDSRWR